VDCDSIFIDVCFESKMPGVQKVLPGSSTVVRQLAGPEEIHVHPKVRRKFVPNGAILREFVGQNACVRS
jgi:hypothetical protein